MLFALTHIVSPCIDDCELSFRKRTAIDYEKAVAQHENYCNLLRNFGIEVIELTANFTFPDSTFIEDTAVVVDEIAVLANMGIESRKGEIRGIEPELTKYRKIERIQPPATLEGGDVLQIGRNIFVGNSPRTNQDGINSSRSILEPYNYEVLPVTLKNCLHLKSACTALDEGTLLGNPNWFDVSSFKDFKIISVSEDEPDAANALRLKDTIVMHAKYTKTIEILKSHGFVVETIDISELIKAEAGLTCSSIIFR